MDDWDRLGEFVKARREHLGMTQTDVQQLGGPSPALQRVIENRRADGLSSSKRRDLERALYWMDGSIDRILAGADPEAGCDDHTARYLAQQGLTYEQAYREKVSVPGRPYGTEPQRGSQGEPSGGGLPRRRALSPETIHELLITSMELRRRVDDVLDGRESSQGALPDAAMSAAKASEAAAIESFGGVFNFTQALPALRRHVEERMRSRAEVSGPAEVAVQAHGPEVSVGPPNSGEKFTFDPPTGEQRFRGPELQAAMGETDPPEPEPDPVDEPNDDYEGR